MTETMERLQRGRDVAWADLVPAFDHAIALAREDEYRAARASDEVCGGIPPSYSPLVELLAASVPPEQRQCCAHEPGHLGPCEVPF